MALPEILKFKVTKTLSTFCEKRVPAHIREKLRLDFEFRGQTVTLREVRPVWNDPGQYTQFPVAQFRFNNEQMKWQLYWRDRNQKWHRYEQKPPTSNFDQLLTEVDQDPTGIFWG